ncbi:unnamed protein product [Oreochromis niloticus]|nr:unnamed protein product [Mustela putorius furo]
MTFDVDDFAQQPTMDKLDRCTKADLLLVANLFNVSVPLNAKKAEIKQCLTAQLLDKGVIVKSKPRPVEATGGLMVDVGAEAAATIPQATSGRMTPGAEAPAAIQIPNVNPAGHLSGLVTEDLRLALRLKEVELEAKTKEVELMHLRIRAMELDPSRQRNVTSTPVSQIVSRSSDPFSSDQFNASKQIALVPPFRESEVDSYFNAFERIATTLKWPKDVWSLLLQCKLVGKAQEVCASLSIDDSLDYEIVKSTILRAYELVPEAYRQKFRSCEKSANQTHIEFAREKTLLFDKWLAASKVKDFAQLRELVLLEEFKMCLPENVVVYLNEQKVDSLSKAAVLADEFVLTHRATFSAVRRECAPLSKPARSLRVSPKRQTRPDQVPMSVRECFYCHDTGHLIANCPSLRRKEQSHTLKKPKSVGFVRSVSTPNPVSDEPGNDSLDSSYRPFISQGFASLTGKEEDRVPIVILRDTGAAQSLILESALPFSSSSFCGADALVWGVKMSVLRAPLHRVFLQSPLVSGPVTVGVRARLPVQGVTMILGNDLANVAIDEGTDITDVAQLAIFIRGVDDTLTVTEEFVELVPMTDTTTAADIFTALIGALDRVGVDWSRAVSLATDGAPSVIGKKAGVVKKFRDKVQSANGGRDFLTFPCILHQEALCCKSLKMDNIVKVVIQTVNFIRSRSLNHRQFDSLLREKDHIYGLPYHTEADLDQQGKSHLDENLGCHQHPLPQRVLERAGGTVRASPGATPSRARHADPVHHFC